MQKIFLIGDSIRDGYDSYVREIMQDRAQVIWPNDSARFTGYTLRFLYEWAHSDCEPEKIDIVHWNNGLWDVLHVMREEAQTPLDDYKNTLARIARRLKKLFPNAKIIFALTTSVIEERIPAPYNRYNDEIDRYNAAAREVMAREGAEIDDLNTVSKTMPIEWHSQDGTHFTPEGYRALAEKVTECLTGYLK